MDTDVIAVKAPTDRRAEARERDLDWLTALVPVVIISLLYYRLSALTAELLAVGGYLMMSVLLARPCGQTLKEVSLPEGLVAGLIAAFCLPATAPLWLSALIGGVAAAIAAVPRLIARRWQNSPFARPLIHPAVMAFFLALLVFPAAGSGYTLPAQWAADGLTGATPLAAIADGKSMEWWRLLFGLHAGAIGETCTALILLTVVYLLLRRRLRVIAPAAMLGTVALLTVLTGESPVYALLAGGLVPAAVLLGDRLYAPTLWHEQLTVGVAAGLVTVCIRLSGWRTEGVAVALLAAWILTPLLPVARRVLYPAAVWIGKRLRPLLAWLGGVIASAASRLWAIIVRFFAGLCGKFKNRKNNS